LKGWSFLSLRPTSWLLSLGTHGLLILAVLLAGYRRFMDLTLVPLELSPVSSSPSYQPPPEDIWQKPMLRLPKTAPPPLKQPPKPQAPTSFGSEGPVRSVAQVSQLPHFITQVKAVYPEAAKHSSIEGLVVLQVEIDAEGRVMDVQVAQSLGFGCDEAAVEALKQSTFSPAYEDGKPVPVRLRIPYRFKFTD
jgi:periplasmic protein TonB